MPKHTNTKKPRGKIFFDEGANHKLVSPSQKLGYSVKVMPKSAKGIGTKDVVVSSEHSKGMPIVTHDFTYYKDGKTENGATAYIETAVVKPEEFPEYIESYVKFMSGQTSKTLKGYRWQIPLKGEVKKTKLKK